MITLKEIKQQIDLMKTMSDTEALYIRNLIEIAYQLGERDTLIKLKETVREGQNVK